MASKFVKHEVYTRDPFFVDPLPKAHYHPSPERHLTKSQRAISISPSRAERTADETEIDRNFGREISGGVSGDITPGRLSPADELFLRGTNIYETSHRQVAPVEEPSLDETWPSSERPSSLNLTGVDEGSPVDLGRYQSVIDRFAGLKKTLNFSEDDLVPARSPSRRRQPGSTNQPAVMSQKGKGTVVSKHTDKATKSKIPVKGDKKAPGKHVTGKRAELGMKDEEGPVRAEQEEESVLQRYVNRFRNSAPLSREERERQRGTSSKDFWWLQQGSPATGDSFPPPEVESREKGPRETTPLTAANLDKYKHQQQGWEHQKPSRSGIPQSPVDKRTIELQERADRLLERSTSTVVSTDPAVSTEGLGSNLSDSSSVHEYTYRPTFAQYIEKDPLPRSQPVRRERPVTMTTGPEDDILHQWRLRRRMEHAQETAPKTIPTFGFLDKSEQQRKMEQKLDEFKQKLCGKSERGRAVTGSVNVQFTPAPQSVQAEPLPSSHCVRNRPVGEPRIASPVLHPVLSGQDVDPHLHLMCDLLPCPHQGKYQGVPNEGKDTGNKGRYSERADTSKPGNNYQNECQDLGNKGSDSKNVETFEKGNKYDRRNSHEKGTGREHYKQYLEAEKPDVESTKVRRSDSKYVIDDEETRLDDDFSHKTKGKHKSRPKADFDTEEQSNIDRKAHKAAVTSQRDDQAGEDEDEDHVERKNDDYQYSEQVQEKEKKILHPRHTSSPKKLERRGLEAAVGQAIKDHLFNTSSSMVLSSVESLPPTAPVVDRLPRKQLSSEQQRDDAEMYHSDGEFQEDSLLQMLRKQRSQYEQQLQNIDSLLEQMENS